MKPMKNKHLLIIAAIIVFGYSSCKPTADQLQKEQERITAIVNEATAPLKAELATLKQELAKAEIQNQIACCKIRLQQLQKPRELTSMQEEMSEIEAIEAQIAALESELSGMAASSSTTSTVAASDSTGTAH